MRLSRPTTRHLMMIVAATAILIAGPASLWRRSIRFAAISRVHEQKQKKVDGLFSDLDYYLLTTAIQLGQDSTSNMRKRASEELEIRRAATNPLFQFLEYHRTQEAKYKIAASHPWRSIAADPEAPRPPSERQVKVFQAIYDDWIGKFK